VFLIKLRPGRLIQLSKLRSLCEKLLGITSLNDHAFVHDNYTVKIEDRVKTMGNGDDGTLCKFLTDNLLHQLVGFSVDAGRMISTIIIRASLTYLLPASSRTTIFPRRKIALARQNSCFCP
jgi:hypothetical protein